MLWRMVALIIGTRKDVCCSLDIVRERVPDSWQNTHCLMMRSALESEHIDSQLTTFSRRRWRKIALVSSPFEEISSRSNFYADFQHRLSRMSQGGKLHSAPLPDDVKHVLDLATGTGIWAIEFGQSIQQHIINIANLLS